MFFGEVYRKEYALQYINCILESAENDGIDLKAYNSCARGQWCVYLDGREFATYLSATGAAYVLGTLWYYRHNERQK